MDPIFAIKLAMVGFAGVFIWSIIRITLNEIEYQKGKRDASQSES